MADQDRLRRRPLASLHGDDALTPETAGMAEDGLAVCLDVIADADAGMCLGQQRGQSGLSHLKRLTAQIVARGGRAGQTQGFFSELKQLTPK
ncbi:hypothetical protein [Methylocystis sp.]|uniref:hypothetical protein n=1 Tax=Methylocystis sp. TaxID=1911079 RepID=UPI003D0F81CF